MTRTPLEEIRQLYFNASRATIEDDFARAIELLKSLPSEDERERAAVYMDGLAQLRSQWTAQKARTGRRRTRRS